MHKYCVSYDLNNSGKNYSGLIDTIQTFDSIKALYSMWFIKTSKSANEVYNVLKPYIDNDDFLIVIEVNSTNEQGFMPKKVWTWLNT